MHIVLYKLQSADQLEGLRQRSLDIALIGQPPSADDPDLECAQVLSDDILADEPALQFIAAHGVAVRTGLPPIE